jgi:glutamine amidotransferase
MCRLYGFRATEPTKVECPLVHAQNALMSQSRRDLAGLRHGHGWGVATYEDHVPQVTRQAWAAYHCEHFRRIAAGTYANTVLAHVRRATVGPACMENTHPFSHERWAFAHNGTVPGFDRVRPRLKEMMGAGHGDAIAGSTDSEHVFRLLLSLRERDPDRPLLEVLRQGLSRVLDICREVAPTKTVSLNVLWTDGRQLAGSRLGRTLWFVERDGLHDCEICGVPHVRHDPQAPYRAVEVASEPITHERWREIPNGSVFEVTPDHRLSISPLRSETAAA